MTDDNDELVLPATLEETRAAISLRIGDVAEARNWLNLHYEGINHGYKRLHHEIRERHQDIAAAQGDIEALKQHAKSFREDAQVQLAKVALAAKELTRANIERQAEVQREAITLKNDKRIVAAEKEARRQGARHTATIDYLRIHHPDLLPVIFAVADAAQKAVT